MTEYHPDPGFPSLLRPAISLGQARLDAVDELALPETAATRSGVEQVAVDGPGGELHTTPAEDRSPATETPASVTTDGFVDPTAALHGGPAVEIFRVLALSVERLMNTTDPWSIAVVSPARSDGRRRLVSELLARAISERRPVRLVDADPEARAPTAVGADLDPVSASGNYGRIGIADSLAPHPQALVQKVEGVLRWEAARGRSAVIDTPAVTTSSLGFALAGVADAAIYVARPGRTQSPIHAQIREQLDVLGVRVLGVVLDES